MLYDWIHNFDSFVLSPNQRFVDVSVKIIGHGLTKARPRNARDESEIQTCCENAPGAHRLDAIPCLDNALFDDITVLSIHAAQLPEDRWRNRCRSSMVLCHGGLCKGDCAGASASRATSWRHFGCKRQYSMEMLKQDSPGLADT